MVSTTVNPYASGPRFLVAGDGGLVVEFGDQIDEGVNTQVIALANSIENHAIDGVAEIVPTYRSLFVVYDPLATNWETVKKAICLRLTKLETTGFKTREWLFPVLYGPPDGWDIELLAETKGLTPDDVVEIHSATQFSVYMIGFSPGYAYLGGLPESLHMSRRTKPRQWTPAGGIAIGGKQASICSVSAPSGWHFIGRTPVRLFDPARKQPFLLRAGDRVRFRPIASEEYDALDRQCAAGEIGASRLEAE